MPRYKTITVTDFATGDQITLQRREIRECKSLDLRHCGEPATLVELHKDGDMIDLSDSTYALVDHVLVRESVAEIEKLTGYCYDVPF